MNYSKGLHNDTLWKTFSYKTNSLLPSPYSQDIQACNCKVKLFKAVRWHDGGYSV